MVATDMAENGGERLTTAGEIDPELARLIGVWGDVPEHVRRTILGLVDALAVPTSQRKRKRSR
jgi:hypothetical protein